MKHLESKIQKEIVRFVRYSYPNFVVFHIPNGGRRSAFEAARLKQEGVLSGVADLILLMNGKCVFIEVKSDKGKQQQTQKDFEVAVKKQGFEYLIARSVDDIIDFLSKH